MPPCSRSLLEPEVLRVPRNVAKGDPSGWNSPVQKAVLIEAAALTGNHSLDDRIRFAVDDANPTVSKAAITAAKKLKLQEPKGEDKTPLHCFPFT